MLSTPLFAAVLALTAFGLGIASEVMGGRTIDALGLVFSGRKDLVLDGPVLGFWCVAVGFILAGYIRFIAEADERRSLERQILRSPNRRIFDTYLRITEDLRSVVENPPIKDALNERKELAATLRKALQSIALLAEQFGGDRGARYGANIMLTVLLSEETLWALDDIEDEYKPRFMHPENAVPLRGILHCPSELLITDISATEPGTNRKIPAINLPIPGGKTPMEAALPGAPSAWHTGQLTVFDDTSKIEEFAKPLGSAIVTQMIEFFSKKGEGAEISSFLSIRIGRGAEVVGVLNVDCSKSHLLGEMDFHRTFHALVTPMIELIRPLAGRFREIYTPKTRPSPEPLPAPDPSTTLQEEAE